ncbi:MAG: hypothetical protein IPN66_19780 [Candidatus Competibacteraceae bacterium]|nr:hypothetical protein [Candidatus Competibacteraceae bacterium]MBK8964409.1 hypothetical protein [Candidatus Competibacteraceae bacterium]
MNRPGFIPETWKDRAGAFYAFTVCWWYRSATGEPIGAVARFDSINGGGKQIIPFFKPNGRGGFKTGGPSKPVLFGAERLNGHKAPVFVVEGEKVAAALQSLDLAAVTTQGGANKAAGGDWAALAGVTLVYLLPDCDLPGEAYARDSYKALARLQPAPVVRIVHLPELPDKGDAADWLMMRLPDWNGFEPVSQERRGELAAELLALVEAASEPPPDEWLQEPITSKLPPGKPPKAVGRYVATPSGIKAIGFDRNGEPQEEPLCNFTARIVAETARDDGQEVHLLLTLEGEQGGHSLPAVHVGFETFNAMGWPAKHWGSHCIVEPGMATKDKLRAAIQHLSHTSGRVERRTVYAHTGWRKVAGEWLYLHGGGAIGKAGPAGGIEVDLSDLARYTLPAPSANSKERTEAAAASLACLDLAPLEVVLPLLACAYLAPMSQALNVDFMPWVEGPSQSQKSSIAAVMLGHYGAAIDRVSLTASWLDSPNAIEGKLFALADSLAIIDDYAPQPSTPAQNQLDATASRVIRSCGNRQGRGRLRADLSRRPERYPRGLVMGTAEQWPLGESINARLFGVSLKRGEVNLACLSECQAAARRGLLARCMADFIQGLAQAYESTITDSGRAWEEYRASALKQGLDGRAPEQVAFLLVGMQLALHHWHQCGLSVPALPVVETLMELAQRHSRHVTDSQPAERFRAALVDVLASGVAHVEPLAADGAKGHSPEPLHGRHIGWHNPAKGELYLLSVPTLEVINEALRKGDSPLNIRPRALWRQCQQRGLLLPSATTSDGERTSRLVWIAGKAERVLPFRADAVWTAS